MAALSSAGDNGGQRTADCSSVSWSLIVESVADAGLTLPSCCPLQCRVTEQTQLLSPSQLRESAHIDKQTALLILHLPSTTYLLFYFTPVVLHPFFARPSRLDDHVSRSRSVNKHRPSCSSLWATGSLVQVLCRQLLDDDRSESVEVGAP